MQKNFWSHRFIGLLSYLNEDHRIRVHPVATQVAIQAQMSLVLAMMLGVSAALGDEPCKNGCWCDSGPAKNVPDIWPNTTVPMLCGQPLNTCEICSICNGNYPKCPCCNPLFADADTCLDCRLDPGNYAVCGSPSVTYSCDHMQGQCTPKTAGGGAYPTKAGCVAACKATPYNCKNKGQGDQCYAAVGTTGDFANKTACQAICNGPSPTPSPPTPAPPPPGPGPCANKPYCCEDGAHADCAKCKSPLCHEAKSSCLSGDPPWTWCTGAPTPPTPPTPAPPTPASPTPAPPTPAPTPPTPAPPTPASPTPAPPTPLPPAGTCTGKSADLAAVECAAWQDLYDATNGPKWSRRCSDARSDPCSCSDSGNIGPVTCKGGHITAMALYENNLRGTIPSSLAKLSKMATLDLDRNRLTGLVPSLPFAQYNFNGGCILNLPSGQYTCTEPNCNHFKCPLPAGSEQCKTDARGGGGKLPGVHCK
jgi:hypothetical protein